MVLFPANLYITLAPRTWWWQRFWGYTQLKDNPDIYFKLGLVLLALTHCVLAYFLEVCCIILLLSFWPLETQCLKLLRLVFISKHNVSCGVEVGWYAGSTQELFFLSSRHHCPAFMTYPYLNLAPQGYIFPSKWMRKLLRFVRCKRRPANRYKHILASIPPQWPPVATTEKSIN